jgi:hypothetical protein
MRSSHSWILVVALTTGYGATIQAQQNTKASQREIVGTIDSINGSRLVMHTRTGTAMRVDALAAMAGGRSAVLFVGRAVIVRGNIDQAGVLRAETIQRAKDSREFWPPDR